MDLLEIELPNGVVAYVTPTYPRAAGEVAAKEKLTHEKLTERFGGVLDWLAKIAAKVGEAGKQAKANETTITVGIGLTAEGNVVFGKLGAQLNLEVSLVWK